MSILPETVEGPQSDEGHVLKKGLAQGLAEAFPEVTQKDLQDMTEILFESIAQALIRNESVEIRGFGRLSVKRRRAMQARNPHNGTRVEVSTRWAVHFKPSDSLIASMNE
jgi:nucleoid DNA-binding protein